MRIITIIMMIIGNIILIRFLKKTVCEDWVERLLTVEMGLGMLVADVFIIIIWLQLRHI